MTNNKDWMRLFISALKCIECDGSGVVYDDTDGDGIYYLRRCPLCRGTRAALVCELERVVRES